MNAQVTVRLLGPGDAHVLERVAHDVFDNPPDHRLTREFLADTRHHIAVAIAGGVVVGMATGVHYVHPDKPSELWVNEVGVAPSHQRRGVGRMLLATLFAHARTLGCREAWVLTEEDNVAARRLYAASGGHEQRPVYVTFELDAPGAARRTPDSGRRT